MTKNHSRLVLVRVALFVGSLAHFLLDLADVLFQFACDFLRLVAGNLAEHFLGPEIVAAISAIVSKDQWLAAKRAESDAGTRACMPRKGEGRQRGGRDQASGAGP